MDGWGLFLQRVTYKPNFSFRHSYNPSLPYDPNDNWNYVIEVSMQTQDTYNSGHNIVVRFREPIPPYVSDEECAKYLRSIIHKIECHEADEHLRIDGVMKFNPHATGQF